MAKQPVKRRLDGWNRDVIPKGSAEEARHIDRLVDKISDAQYDFIMFPEDMKRWAEPSKMQSELDKGNEAYCRYMLSMCADPLSHGINRGSVVDAIGMYVGMSLFSEDFRKTVHKDVANTLYPMLDKAARSGAKVSDFFANGQKKLLVGLEQVTGKEFGITTKLLEKPSAQEAIDEKLSDIKARMMAPGNNGRIPFTPESAAIMQLSFGAQAYNAMRVPGADCNEVIQQYQAACDTLQKLAEKDGISKEQLDLNVRAVYGKIASRHPDIARYFDETAYQDVTMAGPETELGADNIERSVWRGQFAGPDGQPFAGDFTPRQPLSMKQHEVLIKNYFQEIYEPCERLDQITASWGSKKFEAARAYFADMLQDDRFIDITDSRDPYDVINAAHAGAGHIWSETHKMTKEEAQRAEEAAKAQRGRDVSGLGDFGEDESGPEYY